MSKVATIKDPHFRLGFPPPISRKDDYKSTIYKKVDFIINECQKRKIDTLISTGDLFDKKYLKHYSSIAVKENIELLKYIKESGINLVSIAGNHDLPYNSYENLDDSLYGLVTKLGLIKDISFSKVQIGDNYIYGVPYLEDKDKIFSELDKINKEKTSGNKFVVIHEHFIPFDAELDDLKYTHFYRYTELMQYKNIDGFILGHLHRGIPIKKYEYESGESQIFINQWSLYRLARNYYSSLDLHKPELVILDLDNKEAESIIIDHNSFKEVFQSKIVVEDEESVTEFVDSTFDFSISKMESSIQNLINSIEDKEIKEIVISYLEKVDK